MRFFLDRGQFTGSYDLFYYVTQRPKHLELRQSTLPSRMSCLIDLEVEKGNCERSDLHAKHSPDSPDSLPIVILEVVI